MEELCNWFLASDIYDDNTGAYRAFYSKGKAGPVYPEITAYAVSLACILYKQTKDVEFIQRAEDCAEYLISLSIDGLPGYYDNLKYLFDTGIFISALFDLYNLTKKEKYIDEAHKRLKWLCSYFDGKKFPAVVGQSNSNDWDKVSSVHLAKLAIPLLKGYQNLGDKRYKNIADSIFGIKMDTEDK